MSSIAIRFAEFAVVDLEAIKEWYADQGVPEAGDRILGGIFERVERLREHPDLGQIVPEFVPSRTDLRAVSYRLPPKWQADPGYPRLAQ